MSLQRVAASRDREFQPSAQERRMSRPSPHHHPAITKRRDVYLAVSARQCRPEPGFAPNRLQCSSGFVRQIKSCTSAVSSFWSGSRRRSGEPGVFEATFDAVEPSSQELRQVAHGWVA